MSDRVPTTCVRCAVGCGHVQQSVDEGYGLESVRGDPSHPVNRGLACQRGIDETGDPDDRWLTRPLVRRNGELVPTTWETALERVAEEFTERLAADPHSVGVLGSGQQTNEAAYALGKLARGGFGTRNYDANTTLCMASAVTAYYDAFGSDAPPPTYEDVPEATSHVVWGANPAVAHPVLYSWIAKSAADGRMLVVDPVATDTADDADTHVAPEPGTDLALARGVLAAAIERDAIDEAFVEAHTEGFPALRERLPTVAAAAETTGVPVETIETLAAAFEDDTLVYWGMGVNQSVQGTATAAALIDCCLATGNLEPGSGPFSLTGQANSMGTRVCSSKGTWPGHREFDDPVARRAVAERWGVSELQLPEDPGPGPVGIVEAIDDGPVEALWTVATNPAAGLPDAANVRERLDEVFLVAQDAFHGETVELADVVLPAATWGETDGTIVNMERSVSRVRSATDLPAGVKPDLDIVCAVAERVAPGLLPTNPDPAAIWDELRGLTAGTKADCSGISYERLDEQTAVRWPAPDPDEEAGYRYHTATSTGGTWTFPTDSGRARFSTATHGALAEPTDDTYPLTLTTGREADHYNTGVRTSGRRDRRAPPTARIHPDTLAAHEASVRERDGTPHVRIESRRGAVRVGVEADASVREGLVWLPIHNPVINELTLPDRDPRSAEPNLKQCAVRLAVPRDGVCDRQGARRPSDAD